MCKNQCWRPSAARQGQVNDNPTRTAFGRLPFTTGMGSKPPVYAKALLRNTRKHYGMARRLYGIAMKCMKCQPRSSHGMLPRSFLGSQKVMGNTSKIDAPGFPKTSLGTLGLPRSRPGVPKKRETLKRSPECNSVGGPRARSRDSKGGVW